MVLLDKIKEMKKQGMSDSDVVRVLMQEGVYPREINNALSQEKIKAAVSGIEAEGIERMQQSLSSQEPQDIYPAEQPFLEEEQAQEKQEQAQEQPEQQIQYPTEAVEERAFPQAQEYGYEQYEPMPQAISGDIASEIAEQIVDEKLSQVKKQIETLQELETNIGQRVMDMEKRLERIENIIDTLQNSFIKKIGIYGQNLEDIKTEMQGMQDTFGKMVNPLLDNIKKQKAKLGKNEHKRVF